MRNYISNKDESVRMFNNNILEALSRVHPTVPLIIYAPIVILLLYNTINSAILNWLAIIVLFFFGILIWTFVEYILHRFLFHLKPIGPITERLHFIFHGVHHSYPNDSKRLVMVPSVSIPLAIIFYLMFFFIFGDKYINSIFSGFVTGYLIYDMTHYAIHHFTLKNKIFLHLKKYHLKHHYQDDAKGFGVSQPLWDYIFGTQFK